MDPLARDHPDPHASGLPPLTVDRQRIIHSAAFRRLEYKTQVFVALEGDHYRTRLTHTLEVANVARILAATLGLNPDLAECAALAHDLGHPPFGHAGERALDECTHDHGGFEHNAHSLRIVEYLEHPYPEFRGLNLTRAVRECLAKHSTQFDRPGSHPLQDGRPPSLEGQVAALADRLAYGLHDLQDGLHAGLIDPSDLAGIELWRSAYSGPAPADSSAWRGHLRPAMDRIQASLVADVVDQYGAHAADQFHAPVADPTQPNAAHTPRAEATDPTADGVADQPRTGGKIELSASMDARLQELEAFLLKNLYRHNRLVRMDSKARRIIRAVFEAYVVEPALMPKRYAARVGESGVQRVATDYIAGMTDRFCLEEHAHLFDPRMAP
jgi:dGTPase